MQVFVFDFRLQLLFLKIIFLDDFFAMFLDPTLLATCCLGMAVTG